ncbi:hypothetical protein JCGZ_12931 [Jatropha curcas]|uniref:Uncharacterized protein n=1 Tax=Jatropha curcas TaxID=180498 RepID=A0A067LGH0_JATCU|nr:hypothetical protein JCGZ_12931 [Jatropha curcas]
MELIKAKGLGYVNLRQVIAEGYPTCYPSGPMRPNPPFSEMVPKKSKSSKMAKVIEAMKKKAIAGISGKEAPSVVLDTQPIKVDAAVGVTHSEQPPSSPPVELLRKGQREVRVPVPSPIPPRALDIRSYFLHKYGVTCSLWEESLAEKWLTNVYSLQTSKFNLLLSSFFHFAYGVMGSSGDDDVQMLHDQFGDEHAANIDLGVGEAKGRKENVRITGVPSHIDEGELLDARGLGFVNMRHVIAEGYPTCYPGGPMRPNPSFSEMAPKKYKSFKMAKVIKAMKKKVVAGISGKEGPSVVLDTQPIEVDTAVGVTHSELPPSSPPVEPLRKRQREVPIHVPSHVPPRALDIRSYFLHKYGVTCNLWEDEPSREVAHHCLFPTDASYFEHLDDITKLKIGYTKMKVKKSHMEDALKGVEVTMREQEPEHKAEIATQDADVDRLREENWKLLNKNKELESRACLSLRINILTELKAKEPEVDWGWIYDVYPDEGDEDEEGDEDTNRLSMICLPQGRN